MDPLTVLSTLWRHKWTAIPVIMLTLAACAYVYLYAPRTYEASMSYALAAPDVPSEYELEQNKDLAKLNSDNPYLRTGDSSLLSQVVIAKLSDLVVVEALEADGLGTEFTIAPIANLGMGLVKITATANTPEIAVKTAQTLGDKFTSTIKSTQEVNSADPSYLYTALPVQGPGPAQELYSSRLRSLIMVGIAGAVLLFGLVSISQSLALRRTQNDNRPLASESEQLINAPSRERPGRLEMSSIGQAKNRHEPSQEQDFDAIQVQPKNTQKYEENVRSLAKTSGGRLSAARRSNE
ncbi:hypothetical protein FQ154_07470 [Paeniglutamicibacter gangotriensis]|uniref:Chain-length determining protein n=1 Tax=Paeniglutamicibacter gangotriensis TaxID=254787 RepID=A0A5B0EF85_9MICC|nr:hypothetical protein [Paeniglutamicibacter gangotriensis]KAA0977553.1 hypothetical protein FQ154_07470 [Paeniglutamicibacter gangotriensis]